MDSVATEFSPSLYGVIVGSKVLKVYNPKVPVTVFSGERRGSAQLPPKKYSLKGANSAPGEKKDFTIESFAR